MKASRFLVFAICLTISGFVFGQREVSPQTSSVGENDQVRFDGSSIWMKMPFKKSADDLELENGLWGDRQVSPKDKLVAFTVQGNTHDWIGIYDLARWSVSGIAVVDHGDARTIHWSPAGRFFAVETVRPGGLRSIVVLDGHQRTQPTALFKAVGRSSIETYAPVWSRDGKLLTFIVKDPDEQVEEKLSIDITTGKVIQ